MSSAAELPVQTVSGNGQEIVERTLPEAVAEERSNPFMERNQKLWEVCWKSVQEAQSAVHVLKGQGPDGKDLFDGKDFGAVSQMLNQAHRNLELYGKATGMLHDGQPPNQVLQIAIVMPEGAPSNVPGCPERGDLP